MSGGMPAGRVAQNAKSDVIVNDLPSAFIDRTGSRHSYGAGPMAVHVARNALHQETRRDLYSGNAGDPQLGYDGAHRLVQLKRTKVNGEHWQAEYAYDPLSRRIRKQVQYTDAHGQQHPAITTCYGWDGDQQSAEAMQDPEGEWHIRTTLYEPGSFVPLLRMDQSHPIQDPMLLELKRQQAEAGEPLPDALREALAEEAGECRYASYHTDHLGTPLALTDEQGQTLWEASPDDWAAVSNQQGDTDQPLRFQGQYEDEESGLYYNRHRYYDPKLGRYVNQDPIGLLGGMNSYAYPHAPTEWVDPLGLKNKDPVLDGAIIAKKAVDKANGLSSMKKAYEEGEEARVRSKEISCIIEAEKRRLIDDGYSPYSAEVAAAAAEVRSVMAGPASDVLERTTEGALASLSYLAGYATTIAICTVSDDNVIRARK